MSGSGVSVFDVTLRQWNHFSSPFIGGPSHDIVAMTLFLFLITEPSPTSRHPRFATFRQPQPLHPPADDRQAGGREEDVEEDIHVSEGLLQFAELV